jgi:adenine-specific DNA-methyltransferase
MREMLTDTGSIFVQIGDDNLHRVRVVMDEVFGSDNFIALITYLKTTGATPNFIASTADYIFWFGKNKELTNYKPLFTQKALDGEGSSKYDQVEMIDGTRRGITPLERQDLSLLPSGAKIFRFGDLTSQSYGREKGEGAASWFPVAIEGREFRPALQRRWTTNEIGMQRLIEAKRVAVTGNNLAYISYIDDFPAYPLNNIWTDIGGIQSRSDPKIYAVQTSTTAIERCILMTTDPGDLVFDPTCSSGTSAYVAEYWGRRWITCDTSRVALALARQRLMTATFPMYKLAHADQGAKGAFVYKTVPHITLKSIAQNEPPETETLYDQPEVDRSTTRVAGPFTVEAVQPPALDPDAVDSDAPAEADDAASYIDQMLEQLRRSGLTIRGQHVAVTRISPLIGGVLHAEADYVEAGKTVTAAVIFGPQYGPLTSSTLQEALNEARGSYSALIACGFNFDAPAHALMQKATLKPPVIGVSINADLLMGNLLKTSKASQVFSVFGKPDVTISPPSTEGYTVTVRGVDVYDPNTGDFEASSAEQVAAWFLDTDYDGATFLVRQAYFPGQSPNPWERLSKALKGSVDPDQFAALQRTTSLPFKAGKHKQCAVKVIDNRGNEVMTVLRL